MTDKYSLKELAVKIDWEGGIEDTILYGVTWEEVPPEIAYHWKDAEACVESLRFISEKIYAILDEIE